MAREYILSLKNKLCSCRDMASFKLFVGSILPKREDLIEGDLFYNPLTGECYNWEDDEWTPIGFIDLTNSFVGFTIEEKVQ